MEITKEKYLKGDFAIIVIPIILSLIGLFLFYVDEWLGLSIWFSGVVFFGLLFYNDSWLLPFFLLLQGTVAMYPFGVPLLNYFFIALLCFYWLILKIGTLWLPKLVLL